MRTVFSQINHYDSAMGILKHNARAGRRGGTRPEAGGTPANYHVTIDAPLMQKSKLKELGRKVVLTEDDEADLKNNLFRNARANVLNLDSLVDNYNADSYFKGSISKGGDVDYYTIHTAFQTFAKRPVYITMDVPEDSGCRMAVYDRNGNQVGISEPDGEGRQTLKVPCDWSDSRAFTLRIEGGSKNQEADIPYKLTFRQGEVDPELKALLGKNKDASKASDENVRTIQEIEQERRKKSDERVAELHEKQYRELFADERYDGDVTVEDLLARKRRGESLTDGEQTYLDIYGRLEDISDVENGLRFDRTLKELREEFAKAGLDISGGMHVEISFDGSVRVSGLSDEENELAGKIIREGGFAGELKNGYLFTSEKARSMPDHEYKIAMNVDELDRLLSKASGGRVSVDDIAITEKTSVMSTERRLAGLPGSLDVLINDPEPDSVFEDYNRMLYRVLEYRKQHGRIPRFNISMDIAAEGITVA